MASFPHDCWACKVKNVNFEVKDIQSIAEKSFDHRYAVFAQCSRCTMPVSAIVEHYREPESWDNNIDKTVKFKNIHPKNSENIFPNHVPKEVIKVYRPIEKHLYDPNDTAAVSIIARATLEEAFRYKIKELLGKNKKLIDPEITKIIKDRPIDTLHLREYIEIMYEMGIFTKSLYDWAHEIKITGDFGAHHGRRIFKLCSKKRIKFSEDVIEFTNVILEFLFTIPYRISKHSNVRSGIDQRKGHKK